jgi:hypothetical protein
MAKRWLVVSGCLYLRWGRWHETYSWTKSRRKASVLTFDQAKHVAGFFWGGDVVPA